MCHMRRRIQCDLSASLTPARTHTCTHTQQSYGSLSLFLSLSLSHTHTCVYVCVNNVYIHIRSSEGMAGGDTCSGDMYWGKALTGNRSAAFDIISGSQRVTPRPNTLMLLERLVHTSSHSCLVSTTESQAPRERRQDPTL